MSRARYRSDPERFRQIARKDWIANGDHYSALRKARGRSSNERRNNAARMKAQRAADHDAWLERERAYRTANRDRILAREAAHRAAHPTVSLLGERVRIDELPTELRPVAVLIFEARREIKKQQRGSV
jgi:hypothetical protein